MSFDGETLTALDELEPDSGALGRAAWGPQQLLGDLELRVGAGLIPASEPVRVASIVARMTRSAPLGRFYSRSFEIDPLGTARAVLSLRDSLVAAGWEGQPIPNGGPRLDAIHELESMIEPELPAGPSDRLRTVARLLQSGTARVYSDLALAESTELWPARWQGTFRALERRGTHLHRDVVELPGAPPDSDLGSIQAALQGGPTSSPVQLRGDGSFVVVRSETSWEAARATAALLASGGLESAVVIRQRDVSAIDHALLSHGLRTQGWSSRSRWRAALQLLPLALELAFEPKDPYRVLELLTSPVGPFCGFPGHRLARALEDSPGIGGPRWEAAKSELSKLQGGPEILGRVSHWLEHLGTPITSSAPKSELLAVVERVRSWLLTRVAHAPNDATLLTATAHSAALQTTLDRDPRSAFTLVEARRLAEAILESSNNFELEPEQADRVDHVSSPAGLRGARQVVVWWSFVEGSDTTGRLPWRGRELAALSESRIHFPAPTALLAERAATWRRAVLAATRQLILVVPRTTAGKRETAHPLWDELVARTGLDAVSLGRTTLTSRDLLHTTYSLPACARPPLQALEAVTLPGGHPEWRVSGTDLGTIDRFSPVSLEALLGCPLKWALRYRAGLRAGGHALPALFQLNGTLGHRLIEELHSLGAFELSTDQLRVQAENSLARLIEQEGASLLRPGMRLERSQLCSQLVHAVLELARMLRAAGLQILAVEKSVDVPWRGARLEGRIDLVVGRSDGARAVIDVKWGLSSYRKQLQSGQALQLAAYVHAETAADAAYFGLKQQRLVGLGSDLWPDAERVAGPSLPETWAAVERSTVVAERCVAEGRLPATGLERSLPMLTALGVAEVAGHFQLDREAPCTYCGFDALCGRRWEVSA